MKRFRQLTNVESLLSRHPVVALLGARQVGKTTLAHMVAARHRGPITFLDLEDPRAAARMAEPMLALEYLRGLVILDEIQHRPDLFPVLRVLADRRRTPARFLVLGSASPELLQQSSETLAGRIAHHEVGGFDLDEVGPSRLDRLWLRGGLPRSFLASTEARSVEWREEYVRTFLERDLPAFGLRIPAVTLRRFWSMLAHVHGQPWNASEFGRAFGVADTTVRRYLDLLTSAFVVRQVQPWFENLGKRQVKAPRVYLSDPGLLHVLLGIRARGELQSHPAVGASWEGFCLQQVAARLGARPEECFFWRTHTGAELDLLVVRGNRRLGFEFKRTDAPKVTPSMRSALVDLKLDRLEIVHAGRDTFPLGERVRAIACARLLEDVRPLSTGT
jgi:uncharacterized protein